MRDIVYKPQPDKKSFPRVPLIGAGALIVLAVLSAAEARINGGMPAQPTSAPLTSRDLTFQDQADGGILVTDANSKVHVATLEPGSNNFLRAALRGVANRRKFAGDDDRVFHLTAWVDGRLTLDDPLTHRLIDLEAFGRTNEESFARLLDYKSVVK